MVLQQGISHLIRGEAGPGAGITVSFKGKTYQTKADSGGKWRLFMDSQDCGGPFSMEITADNEKITLDDVYIGDVWLCSGQSNMELPMQRVKDDFPEEWKPPINPLIRQFKVPQECEFAGPRAELSGGCWKVAAAGSAGADTLNEFSASAWFFAKALFENHQTPIGLINAAWGGTPAEAWMSREALAPFPEKTAAGDRYNDPALREEITRATAAALEDWQTRLDNADRGLAGAWQQPETAIGPWGKITLPGEFADIAELTGFCGSLWLARDFDAPASCAARDARIWLSTIVDADTVFINGVKVGEITYRYPPRKYAVPAGLLRAGKNRVVIRVICNNGEGRVTIDKPFRIFTRNTIIELGGTWKYHVGASMEKRPDEFFFQRQPASLFNAMIAPVLDYPLKGILWYQGEANDGAPHEYATLFPALINDWRGRHQNRGYSRIPFLFVQLPIWRAPSDNDESSSWAIIREAQAGALSLPMTGMAAGLEFGEWNDLHPINKKGIGQRLALAAEKVVYGARNTSPGPLVHGVERVGKKLLITFDNCGEGIGTGDWGLAVNETIVNQDKDGQRFYLHENSAKNADQKPYVSVVAAGGQAHRLAAEIVGPDRISIDISAIEKPERVLYAWANNPRDRGLYNSEGLPVIPFRVEIPH